ncbi:hypothetical protein ACM66B_001879 [Microbotryomycetes sp. NB124-2]
MSYPDVFAGPASSATVAGAMIGAPQSSITTSSSNTSQGTGYSLESIIANTSGPDAFSLATAYHQAFQPISLQSAANGTSMIPALPQTVAADSSLSMLSSQLRASSGLGIPPYLTLPQSSQTSTSFLAPPPVSVGILTPTTEQALNQAIEASLSPVSPLSATASLAAPPQPALAFGPPPDLTQPSSVIPADTVSLAPSMSDASVGAPPSESPQSTSPSPRKRTFLEMANESKHEATRAAIALNEAPLRNAMASTDLRTLTTVLCLHPWAGQRCYGKEKRLLSPPPIVRIVGPLLQRVPRPRLKMEVINIAKGVTTAVEQASFTDDIDRAYFRKLHINGMGKAKDFNIRLTVHPEPAKPDRDEQGDEKLLPPIATFMSADIDVISKPSKKMVNGLATQSTISQSSTVAFLSRLSNQSARTYFMSVEDGQVLSRLDEWSAFSMRIVREPENAPKASTAPTRPLSNESQTVPCGSEIILTDILSGYETESLMVHQIEKDEVIFKHTGPVGQMQRVALSRLTPSGKRIFLTTQADGLDRNGNQMSAAAQRKPRKRAKKDDPEFETRPVLSYEEALSFKKPTAEHPLGVPRIGDHMIWTIVGVTSFSYSLFESRPIPNMPIERPLTPFPILASAPKYIEVSHSLEMSVSDFFYTNPDTNVVESMELWLGKLGPMPLSCLDHVSQKTMSLAEAVHKQLHENQTIKILAEMPPCSMMVQAGLQQGQYPTNASAARIDTTQAGALEGDSRSGGPQSQSMQSLLGQSSNLDLASSVARNVAIPAGKRPLPHDHNPEALLGSFSAHGGIGPALEQSVSASSLFDSKPPSSTSTSPPLVGNSALPLVIIRPGDGIGYLTGRWVNASVDDTATPVSAGSDVEDARGSAGWVITIT